MRRAAFTLLSLVMGLAIVPGAQAHKASDAYLTLKVGTSTVEARIDVALRDLDRDLDLDANADDQLSWKEVRTRWGDISGLVATDLHVSSGGKACLPGAAGPSSDAHAPAALTQHSDGTYAVVQMSWQCAATVQQLDVDYELFAKTDPTHRGIVQIMREMPEDIERVSQLAVLSPGMGWHHFKLPPVPQRAVASAPEAAAANQPPHADVDPGQAQASAEQPRPAAELEESTVSSFFGFVREGVHHILIGYDHILFLISLLLPAVWVRGRSHDPGDGAWRARWSPSGDLRSTLTSVLKVVTAFTVAHSITLALSVLNVVDPPSRWVESIIAASVVLAALNNVWPVVSDARWKLTFAFGLVHGFGFASALKDAGLAKGALVAPLVGFNVGVELGQLCIVALILPVAWWTRGSRGYRIAFAGGSLSIAGVAGIWLVQRAFDLSLIAG